MKPIALSILSLVVALVGIYSFYHFVFNYPVLIESESFGGMSDNFPDIMIMNDGVLYRSYIENNEYLVSSYQLDEARLRSVRKLLENAPRQLLETYELSSAFDDADIRLYYRNSHSEVKTYIYGYTTKPEPTTKDARASSRSYLKDKASDTLVEILDEIPYFRENRMLKKNQFAMAVFLFWMQKQARKK